MALTEKLHERDIEISQEAIEHHQGYIDILRKPNYSFDTMFAIGAGFLINYLADPFSQEFLLGPGLFSIIFGGGGRAMTESILIAANPYKAAKRRAMIVEGYKFKK